MIKSHASRSLRVLVLAVAALAVSAVAFASVASAEPKGIFKVFNDCPTTTPGVTLCSWAKTTSGEFSLGSTKVPITSPIILQGGAIPTGNEENEREYFLVPAKDGNSLSKTELNVPGGLTNLVNCTEIKGNGLWEVIERGSCKAIFENGLTGVTMVTELAASATNPPILDLVALSTEEGTALTLPTKVHLKNPLLGESCYIGSEAHPVQLHLTTGTSGTLKGKRGHVENKEEFSQVLLRISENTLVDNTYTAPVAEGCGGFFSFLIDPIINGKLGLPSKAGANKAVLNGELESATVEAVKGAE
jgi:hypothetical protein